MLQPLVFQSQTIFTLPYMQPPATSLHCVHSLTHLYLPLSRFSHFSTLSHGQVSTASLCFLPRFFQPFSLPLYPTVLIYRFSFLSIPRTCFHSISYLHLLFGKLLYMLLLQNLRFFFPLVIIPRISINPPLEFQTHTLDYHIPKYFFYPLQSLVSRILSDTTNTPQNQLPDQLPIF